MMNQEIINNGAAVRGEIVPIDINGRMPIKMESMTNHYLGHNLLGYYQMRSNWLWLS